MIRVELKQEWPLAPFNSLYLRSVDRSIQTPGDPLPTLLQGDTVDFGVAVEVGAALGGASDLG